MQGKQCRKCGEIKPLAEFKRRLTKAQSIARGYTGAVFLEIESSMCKPCQPKPKPPTRMTKKELHNKVMSGDVHPVIAELVLDRRKRMRPINQGMASRKQWLRKWDKELSAMLKPMMREIQAVERQLRYADKTRKPSHVKFFSWYAETLRQQKATIELDYAKNPRQPPTSRWEDMIEGTVMPATRDAWGEIPLDERTRLKQPALVVHRAD